jgi:predicted dehydrogenase
LSRRLQAAVVGLGVGEQHARAYARSADAELRWVFDRDQTRMSEVLAGIGAGRAAGSFEEILRDPETDVLSIATYDDHHFDHVLPALRAGKHVFCEKPLCLSLAQLVAIREAWQGARDRHLACNLVLRSAPLYRWLRDFIASGELGEIYAFDGDYLYGRLHKITDGWRKNVTDYSVMLGGGVHLVDLMIWLTQQRPSRVAAVGNRVSTRTTAFRYNDFAAATFAFESGLIGRVTANFGSVHRHQHVVRVFGTKGSMIYDDLGPRLHRTREPSAKPTLLDHAPLPASKGELIPGFLAGIRDGADASSQLHHELEVITACLAADRALASGTLEEIDYP